MRNVLITGATGFIGKHVIMTLQRIAPKCNIIATSRNPDHARHCQWFGRVDYVPFDLHLAHEDFYLHFKKPDTVIHLAWNGLPCYDEPFHIEENLPVHCLFLRNIIEGGVQNLVVAGTCHEYGLRNGSLSEDDSTSPVTQYGLAKDTLRRYCEMLAADRAVRFNWARLFFLHGEGQKPRSLLPLLKAAIERGDKVFNMSGGEQLRDYLPVDKAAYYLCLLALQETIDGIVNICSGKPISVRQLVEKNILEAKAPIKLNLGYYPYLNYEPMAFWGDATKLQKVLGSHQ
jgi:dTDP-6-deoxy-L-talose 4-dehydrogenase (NAD+)